VVICSNYEIRVNQTTSNSARVAINFDFLIHSIIHLTLLTLQTPLAHRDRFVVFIPHIDRIQPLHKTAISKQSNLFSSSSSTRFLLIKFTNTKQQIVSVFCSYESNDSRKLNKQKNHSTGRLKKYSRDCKGKHVRRVSKSTKDCFFKFILH
jgi:hypothetical protein